MKRRIFFAVILLLYLLVVGYLTLRPFWPIPGLVCGDPPLRYDGGAVHILTGAALEQRSDMSRVRKALMASGRMSLSLDLLTDNLQQRGRIIGYARDCTLFNFELTQEGNGISFAVHISGEDGLNERPELLVPAVLSTNRWQHLMATYDGRALRLFVDGTLHGQRLIRLGDFSGWERDYALVIGDEPAGGLSWNGRIRRIAIHDRALDASALQTDFSGAILEHDFSGMQDGPFIRRDGLRRLRWRNLFIVSGASVVSLDDCIANIVGFIPLGFLVYLLLPLRIERRRLLSVIVLPLAAGFVVSGGIEFAQRYIALRVPCAADLIYNATGALLGGLLAWLANSTYVKRQRSGTCTMKSAK